MDDLNVEVRSDLSAEVFNVRCDDGVRSRTDGRSQHMSIIRIRKFKGDLNRLDPTHTRARKPFAHELNALIDQTFRDIRMNSLNRS